MGLLERAPIRVCIVGLGSLYGLMACTAEISGGGGPPGSPAAGAPAGDPLTSAGGSASVMSVGALPNMRRLTAREYNNTVRDLLGDESSPADAFDPDGTVAGFDNQVALLSVSTSRARQYWRAAEQLAHSADLAELSPCDSATLGEQACAEAFVASVGKRAFRQPVDPAESAILLKVYAAGRDGGDHATGLRQVLKAVLVMPQFLYRLDTPAARPPSPSVSGLDGYQVASRLSYTFLQTMPDAELLAAADAGQLGTPEQIAAQVARLVRDPRAAEMSQDFYERWLGLGDLAKLSKSGERFPTFDDGLRSALQQELRAFMKHSLWSNGGGLGDFLGGSYSFRNQRLSEHYADSMATGEPLTLVQLAPERSAGILTTGGVMALLSTPEHTDPVRRGKFIRERLLCQPVPPPPPGVDAAFPQAAPNLTTRERFAQHQNDPVCASCHRLMDGMGLGFENFDAVGKWRATENGAPVDASGAVNSSDIDGPFNGARELAEKLSSSAVVQDCVTATWFRYLAGREAVPADAATLTELKSALQTSGQRGLLEAFTRTQAYLTRFDGDSP